jgi:hypothetical protein
MKLLPVAILCGLFFGVIGVLSVFWTVVTFGRGEPATAIVTMGVAVFCFGFIVPFVKIVPGNVRPRVEFDDRGTTIAPDRGIDLPIQVSLLGLVVAGGLFAILAPLGKLDVPVPEGMRLYLPFVGGVAALTGAPILWRSLRRGGSKYLLLTPEGFEIVQGWTPKSGNWTQIRGVTDVAPGQSVPTRGAIVIVMSDESVASMAAGSTTPDGQALRELIRFYWQHADRRSELTDGGALDRLNAIQIG